ncbi:MAG TPA: hypothetical protein VKM55_31070 [Candidatus Lokiarchaeia archaeon]|nr:hypothetical protein [Candidatus Lokiarchaeia archaeon]
MSKTITSEKNDIVCDPVVALLESGQCKTLAGVANVLVPEGISRAEVEFHVYHEWRDCIIDHVHNALPAR